MDFLARYRIFIATPSDLDSERKVFYAKIDEVNQTYAKCEGIIFEGIGWETILPAYERPQDGINKELQDCDYCIVAFWERWGSSPGGGKYTSGCQEEFEVACQCKKTGKIKEVILLFKDVDPVKWNNPDEDLRKVKEFKERMDKEKFLSYRPFKNINEFASKIVSGLLHKWVRENRSLTEPARPELKVNDISTGHEDTMRGGPNG